MRTAILPAAALRTGLALAALVPWSLLPRTGLPLPGSGLGPVPVLAAQLRAPGPDSTSLRHSAEREQARFERLRRRLANPTPAGYRGDCDVTVGRMCLRFGPGDDWWPEPEPPELLEARDSLLVRLARIGHRIPGDGWISGQRVAYLSEVHRLDAALEVAEGCASSAAGWCHGLQGLVLHRQGRFLEAAKAFRAMLSAMDTVRAREWADPSLLLDRQGRAALDGVAGPERNRRVNEVWRWADPLFLVPGNDRWTGHQARRVTDGIRQNATNPYHLPWGDDLSETLLRYGWERGWERVDPSPAMMTTATSMRGQEHPHMRSFMPPGQALDQLERTTPADWSPSGRADPRTGYAPAYAPVFLPAEGRFFRFPRGDSLVVVAWLALPGDTSVHADHEHPPLPETLRWQGQPPAMGLFAEAAASPASDSPVPTPAGSPAPAAAGAPGGADPGERLRSVTRTGRTRGALRLSLPPGRYLLSGEVWAPDSARAGRVRRGLVWESVPPDVPTLSDLVLLAAAGRPLHQTLDEALPLVREGPLQPGDSTAVAWELNGLSGVSGSIRYAMTLRREGGGLLKGVGRLLGLAGDDTVVTLSWAEAAPEGGGPALRTTRLILPADVDPGAYLLRLRVELPGRQPLERSRKVRVADPSR